MATRKSSSKVISFYSGQLKDAGDPFVYKTTQYYVSTKQLDNTESLRELSMIVLC